VRIFYSLMFTLWSQLAVADDFQAAMNAFLQKDYKQAYRVWSDLAKQENDLKSQEYLAHLYKNGLGVKQDFNKAYIWYKEAANQGSVKARFNLGRMYQLGLGTSKDPEQAMLWYKKAAVGGEQRAYGAMAFLYEKGLGVDRNPTLAKALYKKEGSHWAMDKSNEINNLISCQLENSTQLFGVVLKCADRAQLRQAIKQAGAEARFESRAHRGDAYLSHHLMEGSSELRVGYTKDHAFATAKYVFPEKWDMNLITKLKKQLQLEMGKPDQTHGGLSKAQVLYKWQMVDGIEINLYRDRSERMTYLSYTFPERRKMLVSELAILDNH